MKKECIHALHSSRPSISDYYTSFLYVQNLLFFIEILKGKGLFHVTSTFRIIRPQESLVLYISFNPLWIQHRVNSAYVHTEVNCCHQQCQLYGFCFICHLSSGKGRHHLFHPHYAQYLTLPLLVEG